MPRLATTHGPISQSTFLDRMGIQLRVKALKKAVKGEQQKANIEKAASRLIDRLGMGAQYQFLGITGTKSLRLTQEQTWPFVEERA